MAKIYISYQRDDQSFVIDLAQRLKDAGHTLTYDVDELSAGIDWRTALDTGLKTSEIFIVVVSKSTQRSQYVLAEVGAARAYALESGRMLLVSLIIDDTPPPLSIQDIHAIIQPDKDLNVIVPKIEGSISTFMGRRAAMEAAASEATEKIQSNAASYIKVALDSLENLERRDRVISYWNKPDLTAAVLRNGWMHTGDGGRMDEDGYLYIVDRMKDMIVIGGENVYSAEVENALAQHPAVAASAVIGIPSDAWGEAVHAVVVLKAGAVVTEQELSVHCHQLIAGYKCPRSVEFREALPLSGAGKIQKTELREPHWAGRTRSVN